MDIRSPEILRRVSRLKAVHSHVYRRVPRSNARSCCCRRSVVALFRRVLFRSHNRAVTPSVSLMSWSRTKFTRKLVILVRPRIGRCCQVLERVLRRGLAPVCTHLVDLAVKRFRNRLTRFIIHSVAAFTYVAHCVTSSEIVIVTCQMPRQSWTKLGVSISKWFTPC